MRFTRLSNGCRDLTTSSYELKLIRRHKVERESRATTKPQWGGGGEDRANAVPSALRGGVGGIASPQVVTRRGAPTSPPHSLFAGHRPHRASPPGRRRRVAHPTGRRGVPVEAMCRTRTWSLNYSEVTAVPARGVPAARELGARPTAPRVRARAAARVRSLLARREAAREDAVGPPPRDCARARRGGGICRCFVSGSSPSTSHYKLPSCARRCARRARHRARCRRARRHRHCAPQRRPA